MNLNDDTEFRNVVNILKQLQQVKAPSNFEADLMRRINSKTNEKTFWQTIFIPSRMVPAAALAVTAVLLVFVLNNSNAQREDPFSTVPRERHDITSTVNKESFSPVEKNKVESIPPEVNSGIQKDEAIKNERFEAPKPGREDSKPSVSGNLAANKPANDKYINISYASGRITDYPVSKAGLNFRQVKISTEQKKQLNSLKEKLDTVLGKGK